ncbi:MAG: DUF4062 domain-containing protein [Candidatus Accumulibacter sp.]|uniref:DUF4062 domain-containing protein n=1 Tax=Candidatus Accumulibacter affinis TaxID=2954384 RepID=A0A935T8I4_9PROT|nr:DUF4062 domain-containing protein [Candidatus Accumulibacter affinis]
MSKLVYLSSTLADLASFRDEAMRALVKAGYRVKDSYRASPQPPADQCLADVRAADIYLGIFAGRYGYCPDGHGGKSITELEYREAVRTGKQCFLFIRPLDDIPGKDLDSAKGEYEADTKLRALREELQSRHTCALVSSPTDLALSITQALPRVEEDRADDSRRGGMFNETAPHPGQLNIGLLIVGIRGCAEASLERLCGALPAEWQPGSALFAPEPGQAGADRLAVDRSLSRARCVALHLSPPGLSRLRENPAAGEALVKMLAARLGSYTLLLEGVQPADLPATWPPAAASFSVGEWLASGVSAVGGELGRLIEAFPEATPTSRDVRDPRLVGLAYSVLAMTRDEARAVADRPELVREELGRQPYEFLVSVIAGLTGRGDWVGRYGACRHDWQPFGNGSVKELLEELVETINAQRIVPRRDQSALLGNHIRLRYYPFEPEAFRQDAPDWPLLAAMRGRGCLVLVDELSTLHPSLYGKGNVFLSDPAVTVATLSSLDPAVCSLEALIDSPLKIDTLVDRFSNKLDLRCELAINSRARARRWLRLSLPEALAGSEAQGADPNRREEFRKGLLGGL